MKAPTPRDLDPRIHPEGRLSVLFALLAAGGRMTWTELQTASGHSPGGMVHHLRELAEGGLVERNARQPSEGAQAHCQVWLTPAGRQSVGDWWAMLSGMALAAGLKAS